MLLPPPSPKLKSPALSPRSARNGSDSEDDKEGLKDYLKETRGKWILISTF
jgi:hypothetical protein